MSNILTMRPSHPSLTLSSRNVWISSVVSPSFDLANSNSPGTGVKWSRKSARRSIKDCCSNGCATTMSKKIKGQDMSITSPFRYNRSNAKRHTRTLMSSTLTSLRFRLLSSWKGISFPVSRSIATASASRTNDLVDSLMHWIDVSGLGSFCESG